MIYKIIEKYGIYGIQIPPAPPDKENRYSFENTGFFCISGDLYIKLLCFLRFLMVENPVFRLVFPLLAHRVNKLFHSVGAITING